MTPAAKTLDALRAALTASVDRHVRGPFPLDGWDYLTNGYALLAWPSIGPPLAHGPDAALSTMTGDADFVQVLRTKRPHGLHTPKLARWLAAHHEVVCGVCDGTGSFTDKCRHPGCDHSHARTCGACNGGKVVARSGVVIPVEVAGVVVDAGKLLPLLTVLPPGVTAGRAEPGLLVLGTDVLQVVLAGIVGEKPVATYGARGGR